MQFFGGKINHVSMFENFLLNMWTCMKENKKDERGEIILLMASHRMQTSLQGQKATLNPPSNNFLLLLLSTQNHIEEAIVKSRNDQLEKLCAECDVNMEDLDGTVQPIIDSCTKDAILVEYLSPSVFPYPMVFPYASLQDIFIDSLSFAMYDMAVMKSKFKFLSRT